MADDKSQPPIQRTVYGDAPYLKKEGESGTIYEGPPSPEEQTRAPELIETNQRTSVNRSSNEGAVGCLLLLGIGVAIAGVAWYYSGSGCPDNWLTDRCVIKVLQSTCGQTREIISVVDVHDLPEHLTTTKSVTYEFKTIPALGATSGTETLRATTNFTYPNSKSGWGTTCE